ncbi:RNA-splicing factor [Sorochytrium milnesiophthora]
MGGGDLNLKKSWHPMTMKNQERVWKEERRAMEEQKKLDQLKKEIAEERAKQELLELQEQAGLIKRSSRIEWMYAGPAGPSSAVTAEQEDFLLGTKRVDSRLASSNTGGVTGYQTATRTASTAAAEGGSAPPAINQRDLMNKIREDPLFAIKRREQDSIKAIMSNPLKVKAIKEASSKHKKEKKEKKHKKDKQDDYHSRRDNHHDESGRDRPRHRDSFYDAPSHSSRSRIDRPVVDEQAREQERQVRLQAMQTAAKDLHTERLDRLERLEAIEKLEMAHDRAQKRDTNAFENAQARIAQSAYGLNGAGKGVGSVADAIERKRFYLERDRGELDS